MKPIDILGLKNFRIFDDQFGFLEVLSSINILTGANNSGKSSIVKALQMLKNSVKTHLYPFDLDLNQQEHLLGDFENILFNKKNRKIDITLPFLFFGMENFSISLSFVIPDSTNTYEAKLRSIELFDKVDKSLLFSFHYREALADEIEAYKKDYDEKFETYEKKKAGLSKEPADIFSLDSILLFSPSDNPLVAYVDWRINFEKLKYYLTGLSEFYQTYLNSEGNWDEDRLETIDQYARERMLFFIPTAVLKLFKKDLDIKKWKNFLDNTIGGQKEVNGKAHVGERDFDAEYPFYPSLEIENILYNKALEVLRRNLVWEDNVDDGTKSVFEHCFSSSWDILIQRISAINYISNIKEENSRGYNAAANSPFINLLKRYQSTKIETTFIDKYLHAFEIGRELIIDYQPKYQLILVSITTMDGKKRELVDFGYGIKQIILILIQVSVLAEHNKRIEQRYGMDGEEDHEYYDPSLLIIEEPESNLHPKWQSLLADMLAEASRSFNIQLIIETHSEYLIRKFQTLVAQKTVKVNDVKIFYLRGLQNVTAGRKQVESLNIQDDGSIDYNLFDTGFFDENYNLNLSLLNIQRDKFSKDFEDLKATHQENEATIEDLKNAAQESEFKIQEGQAKIQANEAKINESEVKLLANAQKINGLEQRIDVYVNKDNVTGYRQLILARFPDHSKLESLSVDYLVAGQFLLENIEPNGDYSPVILQYGRAVENELKQIFLILNPTGTWLFGKMQGSLEKHINGMTTISGICNATQLTQLPIELAIMFNNYTNLRYDLIDDIRDIRNEASHAGHKKTKQQALDYISIVNDFLDRWISEKK